MKYIIRTQRDGWYFTEFNGSKGPAEFGPIQEAKVYSSKIDAQRDLNRMGQYGQRIVAITKIGRSHRRNQTENSQK